MPRKPLDNRRAERAFAIPALAQQTGTVAHNCRATCTKSSEYTEYRFFGKTNSINGMYIANIYKYNEEKNMMEMGTVYFDKKFENIIILSDVMGSLKFYSADESFIKSVDSLYIYSISD